MPNKRGRLSDDERDFVITKSVDWTTAEIATKLNRKVETIEAYIKSRGIKNPENREQVKRQEGMLVKAELRQTEKWKRLNEELTHQELKFFDEEYVKLLTQFGGDVLPSEETQVFDCIKFEILKSRNMSERKRARQEISRLEDEQHDFRKEFDNPRDMHEDDRAKALSLETQLIAARAAEQSRTTEYVKLQERHDALMKSLKSTRDQRIREVNTGGETVLGLLKKLQRREVQEAEGRQMELMRMAADKEYNRLGGLHEYEDGMVDRPILSSDTVGLTSDEEQDTETENDE